MRRRELACGLDLRDADARAEVGWLDEHRQAAASERRARHALAVALPLATRHESCQRHDRQAARREERFMTALSMPTAEPSTPGADVRDVGQLEQPLHRAVLAVRAVQHREDDVEPSR